MGELTFQSVMDFYPTNNRSIFQMLVDEQKKGIIIPFVGAGLSQPFGYKLWGDVLKGLMEYIPEEAQKETVSQLLKEQKYTEAAQAIHEAYPLMIDVLPDFISPKLIQECTKEKLESSAAYILPSLFSKGLVTTTNFDRVIEHVYLQATKNAIPVVTPSQPDRLTQLQQNTSLALFKLHGDIGQEAISYDDLVFTEEQYNEKYADGSALIQALTTAFSTKRLLFLGCSLAMDRTMDVLKTVNKAQPQIRHFAIVGCEKKDIGKRLKELSQLGIRPIFYDSRNHDAVRVLLETLLEKTNRTAYQQLCRAKPKLLPESKEERRLLYDGEYFPFTGRKEEWQRLQDFCDDPETISWWAVTGPGGMGKSRLVYEFAKKQEGWQICRFAASPSRNSAVDSLVNLPNWQPGTEPTLVVLDDVQAYMESVAQWLQKIVHCPRSEKLRILLLEREGKGLQDAAWLTAGMETDIPEDWCYAEEFLELKAMSDPELMEIMKAFSAASRKKPNAELLLKTLERIDPELKRPLYAIAIADAFCQGKDPTNWDKTKVLDLLLERELKFHKDRLLGIIGKKKSKTLQTELQELLAQSCIGPGLLLEEVDVSQYPYLEKAMNMVNMELEEFAESIGILHRAEGIIQQVEEKNGEKIILEERECVFCFIGLSCPDLIKEHLVLEQVSKPSSSVSLLPENWEENPNQLQFLRRLLADYPERLESVLEWNTVFQARPEHGLCAAIFGDFLFGCTARYPKKGKEAVDCLNQLYQEHHTDESIAAAYANGLVNLSAEQDVAERSTTVKKLEKLYEAHGTTEEVVIAYAYGLFNLSAEQDVAECSTTVEKLEKLYEAHRATEEIVIVYAKGLVNLSNSQDVAECSVTVEKLEKLYEAHGTTEEVVIRYAKGLVNLSSEQDVAECSTTVKKLEELYKAHRTTEKVVIAYAYGLGNLSAEQDVAECSTTVKKLEELYKAHRTTEKVVIAYAKGLVNLSSEQDVAECSVTVEKLEKLYEAHRTTEEVVIAYAYGLSDLSYLQNVAECSATVRKLEELYKARSTTEDVVKSYANGLIHLALKQNLQDCNVTFKKMVALHAQYPSNNEITLACAMTWFNLTLHQEEKDIPDTVQEIAGFLRSNHEIIQPFHEELEKYLTEHPEHSARYKTLQEITQPV